MLSARLTPPQTTSVTKRSRPGLHGSLGRLSGLLSKNELAFRKQHSPETSTKEAPMGAMLEENDRLRRQLKASRKNAREWKRAAETWKDSYFELAAKLGSPRPARPKTKRK